MGFPKGIDVVDTDRFLFYCFSPTNQIKFFEERKESCDPEYSPYIQSSNYKGGIVHMEESHTKISRHDIKII